MNIYKISAEEMLDGVIPFEEDELITLADYKGVSVDDLLRGESA